jgi:plastocyanin
LLIGYFYILDSLCPRRGTYTSQPCKYYIANKNHYHVYLQLTREINPEEIVISRTAIASLLLTVLALPGNGYAATLSHAIAIHNGQFVPAQLELPPGVKIKLTITNEDALPAEFESFDLSREIIIPVHQAVTVFIGPLRAGRYEFFNDFNPDMRGTITVKSLAEETN